MAYRYNEKTGEFEDVPGLDKRQYRPQTPRTTTPANGGSASSSDDSKDTHTKILFFLIRLLFYAILGALFSGIIG
jgi:hypothetical protein